MSVDAAQLTDRIEEALRLSETASDDPDIAQSLTDLLKTLQTCQVRTASGFVLCSNVRGPYENQFDVNEKRRRVVCFSRFKLFFSLRHSVIFPLGPLNLVNLQVTTQLLLETQAGKKIRKLAKHSNAAVSQAAAATVSAWKEAVTRETVASTSAGLSCIHVVKRQDAPLQCRDEAWLWPLLFSHSVSKAPSLIIGYDKQPQPKGCVCKSLHDILE